MSQLLAERLPTFFAAWTWVAQLVARWRAEPVSPAPIAPTASSPESKAEPPAPIESDQTEPSPLEAPINAAKPRRVRRSRTQEPADVSTLSELLDHIDGSFDTMAIPPISGNWLPRSEIRALYKLGIYVPTPWRLEMLDHPALEPNIALPSIASAAMIPKKLDAEPGRVHPRFAFAIRSPRLPANVEQVRGKAFRFGYAVALPHKEHDQSSAPHSFWVWAWIVVREDGSIVAPSELRPVVHQINHRRLSADVSSRRSSYVAREWQRPTMMNGDDIRKPDELENFLLNVFRQLMIWWMSRDQRWSVGVRKHGQRITFSIDPEHTSAYFADRNKTIAVDGRSKKIIHFVREHTRANGSIVREHVRGEREFEWRGAHCAVTAPKLYGRITTNPTFPPIDPKDTDSIPHIPMEAMTEMLADAEDRIAA